MIKREKIEAELQRPPAYERINDGNYAARAGVDRTREFHEAMGLPVRDEPAIPSVSERILRAKLLLEETLETIQKGLGLELRGIGGQGEPSQHRLTMDNIVVHHVEGVKYDPIETLDGLADVKVIANGTAVQFGLPLHEAEYEVWCSNMTKLDENGRPVINNLTPGYRRSDRDMNGTFWCDIRDSDEPGYRPDLPDGKLLKPDTYTPANIVNVFVRFAGDGDEQANRTWLLMHGES